MDDEPVANGGSGHIGWPGTGYLDVDGSGDPTRNISPEREAKEAELAQLGEVASRVASTLPGLTIPEAMAAVARTPALYVRFLKQSEGATEDYGWGRITALTRDGVVTGAHAG